MQRDLIIKILSNIVNNPSESKYKRVNSSRLSDETQTELKKLGFVPQDTHLLYLSNDYAALKDALPRYTLNPTRLSRETIADLTEARLRHPPQPATSYSLPSVPPRPKPLQVNKPSSNRIITLADLQKKALGPTPISDEYLQLRTSTRLDFEYLGRLCVDLTNNFRSINHLSPLQWSPEIYEVAQRHAEAVARGNEPFSHENFERRFDEIRLSFKVGGAENLAMTTENAETAVDGWIDSPGHKANLIGNFNYCAVGVARDHGTYFLTQLFVRR